MTNCSKAIIEYLNKKKSMSVEEYMSFVLHDEQYGYYKTKKPIGKENDFITAPQICQIYGELIGLWLVHFIQNNDFPTHIHIVELGPGTGLMLYDILKTIKKLLPKQTLDLHFIEINPHLKKDQKNLDYPIRWHKNLKSFKEVKLSAPIIFIAHEYFDALPIRQFTNYNHIWYENIITLNNKNELIKTTSKIPVTSSTIKFPMGKSNDIFEYSPQTYEQIQAIIAHLKKYEGLCLITDYGYINSTKNTLRAFSKHKMINNIFYKPGKCDITADVNYTVIKDQIPKDIEVFGPITQKHFLQNLNIEYYGSRLMEKLTLQKKIDFKNSINRLLYDFTSFFFFAFANKITKYNSYD